MSTKRRSGGGPKPELWIRGWERPLPEMPSFVHFNEAQAPPGMILPPHRHDTFEVCLIVAGRAEWSNPDGRFVLGPGDIYITRPDEEHDGRADERDPQHNFAVGFDLRAHVASIGDLAYSVEEADAVDALLPRQRVIPGGGQTARIFSSIRRELEALPTPDDPRRVLSVAMMRALLVELAVTITRLAISVREQRPHKLADPDRADLRLVIERLAADPGVPPTLAEMASWIGLSPGHFAVVFKREIGCTPLEHLTHLRIEAAATRLLEQREPSITDIALDLGFCSSQYFSEVFKRAKGITPSRWRADV